VIQRLAQFGAHRVDLVEVAARSSRSIWLLRSVVPDECGDALIAPAECFHRATHPRSGIRERARPPRRFIGSGGAAQPSGGGAMPQLPTTTVVTLRQLRPHAGVRMTFVSSCVWTWPVRVSRRVDHRVGARAPSRPTKAIRLSAIATSASNRAAAAVQHARRG
jgi:hypothetical protein